MSSNDLRDEVEARLAPWQQQLGADRAAYTNHVLRVLALCDLLAADQQPPPSAREEYLTAATLHDIGIWSAGTFDYLGPSCDLARAWLASIDRDDLTGLVVSMINEHHRIRPAGPPHDPVEIFRRADAIDVGRGLLRRFGVSRAAYRDLAKRYPNHGFHRTLVRLTARRLRTNPASPLPMVKW
ncbi:HD domain-containing protein [Nocardia sp. NBC_00508]|uniref:HD domain-containing protein n=1 Tax=Nocardia sp. NBC_00508 TaxID=2975992 RepID=UPI002E811986|nr:HD domain-containing protein [Nocardia sp. NBC_00508]WUD68759.1 HD domain-containing protein [Nocardia sp. NBC_00508]